MSNPIKKLIILNNRGGHSTVLNAMLETVSTEVEQTIVLFPKAFDSTSYFSAPNVTLLEVQQSARLKAIFRSMIQLLDADAKRDFKRAKSKGKLSFDFLKMYIHELFFANMLYLAAIPYVDENTAVLSTWYAGNAIAAAMLKKQYPPITAVSYAHSYEVDFRKNNYVSLLRDSVKERYLNYICFISENVMKEYLSQNKDYLKFPEKCIGMHFGCTKHFPQLCQRSQDGVFRILTCSGISKVKRLHLIVEALAQYKGTTKIQWTHIGNGQLEESLRQQVATMLTNPHVNVTFSGYMTNEAVHQYYSTQPVDLFLNVSASEGLPVSIMEAMAYGVPTMATDVGGNSEIVTEDTGVLLKENITPNELFIQLERYMKSTQKRDLQRNQAYLMWKNEYTIAENIKKILELLCA